MDFSCHVSISNESDQDLLLDDSGLESGNWPLRQPLNLIEAGTQQTIYLAQPSKSILGYLLYHDANARQAGEDPKLGLHT